MEWQFKMITCPQCRWRNEAYGWFCVRCAADLPARSSRPTPAPSFDLAARQPRPVRWWEVLIGMGAGVVANLILAGILISAGLSAFTSAEASVVVLLTGQLAFNIWLIWRWMKSDALRGYGLGLLIDWALLAVLVLVILSTL